MSGVPAARRRNSRASRFRDVVVVLCVSTVLPACGEAPHAVDAPHAAPIDVEALPPLQLHEEARIGSVEDPDYGFSSIGSVQVARDGHIHVYEAGNREVRVYTPSGELLRAMGSRGEGPGEFAGVGVRVGIVRDTVWAMDVTDQPLGAGWGAAGQRLTLFNTAGQLISARHVTDVSVGEDWRGAPLRIVPLLQGPDGYLLGDLALPPTWIRTAAGDGDTLRVPRVRFRLDGSVTDTAGWYDIALGPTEPEVLSVGRSEYELPRIARYDPIHISASDGHIVIERPAADSEVEGTFRVTRIGLDHDTIFSRSFRYLPHQFETDELEAAAARASRSGLLMISAGARGPDVHLMRHPGDSARAHTAIMARLRETLPEFQPPVHGETRSVAVHLGADGSIWIARGDAGDDIRRWIVLRPDGTPLGELTLPRPGPVIRWSSHDTVWGVETDDFDVPWLVRYSLGQGGAPPTE